MFLILKTVSQGKEEECGFISCIFQKFFNSLTNATNK